jgi:hypothetical protein
MGKRAIRELVSAQTATDKVAEDRAIAQTHQRAKRAPAGREPDCHAVDAGVRLRAAMPERGHRDAIADCHCRTFARPVGATADKIRGDPTRLVVFETAADRLRVGPAQTCSC